MHLSAQESREDLYTAQNQNIRFGLVHDLDGAVNGDDYNGFTIAYAAKGIGTDQLVLSYSQLDPENATSSMIQFSVEEYYAFSPTLFPYAIAGLGFLTSDDDVSTNGEEDGFFGKIGFGLLFKTDSSFDVYLEASHLASNDDLWADGTEGVKDNHQQLILGVRVKY